MSPLHRSLWYLNSSLGVCPYPSPHTVQDRNVCGHRVVWDVRCGGAARESRGGVHAMHEGHEAAPHLRDPWLCHHRVTHPLSNSWLFMCWNDLTQQVCWLAGAASPEPAESGQRSMLGRYKGQHCPVRQCWCPRNRARAGLTTQT